MTGLEDRLRRVPGVVDLSVEMGEAGVEGLRVRVEPGIDETAVFAEIRRISPEARAILASGYDESGRLREIVAAGFETFLQKPFRRRELGQKVGEALAKVPRRESSKR